MHTVIPIPQSAGVGSDKLLGQDHGLRVMADPHHGQNTPVALFCEVNNTVTHLLKLPIYQLTQLPNC